MPLPKDIVRLTAEERTELEDLIRTGKWAASVLIHARILLKANVGDGGPGWDDERIAEAVECGASTVYRVRQALVEEGLPAVCLDEFSKQRVAEMRIPIPAAPGQPERVDDEYERWGTANLFLTGEPLVRRPHVTVTEQRPAVDFAKEVRDLLEARYPHAEKVVLVMDSLNTHKPAALYEAFEPAVARALLERLEIHHTPQHGSGLNRAEIELNVRAGSAWIAVSPTSRP